MRESLFISLAAIAAFSLALRIDVAVKAFDAFAVILGLVILADGQTRKLAQQFLPETKPYARLFFYLLLCVGVAQTISWTRFGFDPLDPALLFQYVRYIFNAYIFFLAAYIFWIGTRVRVRASWMILASSILVVPAYYLPWQSFYLSGIRLAGLMTNPIIFGSWILVTFFIGLGLYLDLRSPWIKVSVAVWLVVIANFILWSGARSAWVALPIGIGVLLSFYWFNQKNSKYVLHIIGLVIVSFALGNMLLITARSTDPNARGANDPNYIQRFIAKRAINLAINPFATESRIGIWQDAVAKLSKNPWGFGFFGKVSPEYFPGAANAYLEVLGAGGLGALAMFLIVLGKIGKTVARAVQDCGAKLSALEVSWFAVATAMLVDVFFFNFFLTRNFWFLLGAVLGIALARTKNEERVN